MHRAVDASLHFIAVNIDTNQTVTDQEVDHCHYNGEDHHWKANSTEKRHKLTVKNKTMQFLNTWS